MAAHDVHPNFPHGLDILPLVSQKDNNASFDADAQKNAIQRFGIAGRIWEAAHLMGDYFQLSESHTDSAQLDPPCSMIQRASDSPLSIVELGSGTGYVGLKLAEQLTRLGKSDDLLVLTDLPDVCNLLNETLLNEEQRWMSSHLTEKAILPVRILPLPWGDTAVASHLSRLLIDANDGMGEPRLLTHLVCSDLVYFPHLLAPLLRTLLQLTSPPFARVGQSPEVVISYKVRSLAKETAFWSAFGLWFEFAPVLVRHGGTNCVTEKLLAESNGFAQEDKDWHVFGTEGFIFVAYRRLESIRWIVPDDDNDLLVGIGARGTSIVKSDDTFETLLIMQMNV